MPLVRRKVKLKNQTTTMQTATHEHVLYVPPAHVKRSDEIVEPKSDRQLAELAAQYPDEFGELAKSRGVTPGASAGRQGRLLELMALPAKDLVKEIAEGEDEQLLYAVLEAELSDDEDEDQPASFGKKRKSVIEALAAQGIKDD